MTYSRCVGLYLLLSLFLFPIWVDFFDALGDQAGADMNKVYAHVPLKDVGVLISAADHLRNGFADKAAKKAAPEAAEEKPAAEEASGKESSAAEEPPAAE
jgi:hypothetical protein